MDTSADLLKVFAVAKILDLSPASIRLYADKGKLKCLRTTDGDRIFLRSEVEEFAAQRKKSTKKQ